MNICVYAASSNNISEIYMRKAEELGAKIAGRNHTLIFGGGVYGLMGAVSSGCNRLGGNIIGIVPTFFPAKVISPYCTKVVRPKTLRERKQLLDDLSDAFIALPGGIGTFDEIFDMLAGKQLARHNKAIVLWNINHYYDPLLLLLENAVREGFVTKENFSLLKSFSELDDIISFLENYVPEKRELDI